MRLKLYLCSKHWFGPYLVRYFGIDIHRMFIGFAWWGDPSTVHIEEIGKEASKDE
jgi:hypothetical protein